MPLASLPVRQTWLLARSLITTMNLNCFGLPLTLPLLAAAILLFTPSSALAADYYLSPNGNDANDGHSQAAAWKTIDKLNQTTLAAGDRILFCDGGTFLGSLALTPAETGTPEKPIVIESIGPTRATIISDGKSAIWAKGGGIVIRDLVLKGTATKAQKDGGDGISFDLAGKPGVAHPYVRIDSVEVSGFGDDGISIGGWDDSGEGYKDVRITRCICHDNYGSGISTSGKPYGKTYPNSDVTLSDCVAYDNKGGSGIVVDGVDGGRVEYCRAYGNIGKGGVGIWTWSANHVTIDHCISYGQKTLGGDGDGFDLDGGSEDCVIKYCLSYENDGCGFMHCDYPYAPPTKNNLIRYCISIDDGAGHENSPGIGICTWGSGVDDCVLEGNLAIALPQATPQAKTGELWTEYIATEDKDDHPHIHGCTIKNNIIAVATGGIGFYSNQLPGLTAHDAHFVGNCFWPLDGAAPKPLTSQPPAKVQYPVSITFTEPPMAADTRGPGLPANIDNIDYRLTDPHALMRFPLMKALLASPVVRPLEAGKQGR